MAYKRQSILWLIVVASFVGFIFWYIVYRIEPKLDEWEKLRSNPLALIFFNSSASNEMGKSTLDRKLIHLLISRVLVLGTAIWAAFWAARQYSISAHNYAINRHRHNALRCFEMFRTGTSDPETKNAVLIQATLSIFQVQPTGYLKGDAEDQKAVTEIVRSVAKEKGGKTA